MCVCVCVYDKRAGQVCCVYLFVRVPVKAKHFSQSVNYCFLDVDMYSQKYISISTN